MSHRIVVAGGEASGAIVTALGLGALVAGRDIDPGVPLLFASSGPLAMMEEEAAGANRADPLRGNRRRDLPIIGAL